LILIIAAFNGNSFSIGNTIFAQPSILSNSTIIEGQSTGTAQLGVPFSKQTHSSSLNPLTLTPLQKEQLSNKTEETTLSKPNTPVSNTSIAPPPNETQAVIKNSSLIKNDSNHFTNTLALFKPKDFSFHNIASSVSLSDNTKKIILGNKTVLPANFKNFQALPLDHVNEPSVANNGRGIILYVGNHYTARSTDGGNTFSFNTDPSIISITDQKVIYDNTHHIFIWFEQELQNNDGTNRVFLNISPNAQNWWTYILNASTIFGPQWKNKHIDFPHLALTNRSLYFASNVFDPGSVNNFNRTFVMKISLDDLAKAKNPSFSYYYSNLFGFAPVQGAIDTMYWAAHMSNSKMAIYKWNDIDPPSKVVRYEEDIDPWKSTQLNYDCYTHDNNNVPVYNYCGRSDDRILTGWISDGKVGWMWNVDKSEVFPWPYVDSAVFNIENMNYQGRPLIWSKDFAFQYPAVYPDSNGNLGLITSFGGNNTNTSIAIGYAINQHENISKWQIIPTIYGKSPGVEDDEWGDYLSIQPYRINNSFNTTEFLAAGYTAQSNSSSIYIAPQLIIFGK